MSGQQPPKLLEISILSAQDLAPVSKLLRTYAVVWVHPDQKLTTRVDHHGHTNPTWNYRFVFRVDDKFLTSDASALNVEIYNASWLRDIPIGIVRAPLNNIIPPSPPSLRFRTANSSARTVSLQIRRPSGSLQGIVNLGVNLIDTTRRSMPLDISSSSSSHSIASSDNNHKEEEEKKNATMIKLGRSRSERSVAVSVSTKGESPYKGAYSIFSGGSIFDGWKIRKSPKAAKAGGVTSTSDVDGSVVSSYYMRALPSEVAASMAKGLYGTPTDDVGSSVLENWTVLGDGDRYEDSYKGSKLDNWTVVGEGDDDVEGRYHCQETKLKVVRWKPDDDLKPINDRNNKKDSNGGGLLSCFGIICGYECNIICGTPKSKKNKKKSCGGRSNHSAENLHLLYR